MSGCALQIAIIADAMESGAQPWPIMFAGPNCDVSQWPNAGVPLNPVFTNNIFSLRDQACSNPFNPGSAQFNNALSIFSCPLPAIRSMILPVGVNVTFYAMDSPDIRNFVKDPGVAIVTGGDTNSSVISLPNATGRNWGSSLNGPTGACNYDSTSSFSPAYDVNGLMRQSNLSCGSTFWPSMTSGISTGNSYVNDGTNWNLVDTVNNDPNVGSGGHTSFCQVAPPYQDAGVKTGSPGGRSADYVTSQLFGKGNTGYSMADCLTNVGSLQQQLLMQNSESVTYFNSCPTCGMQHFHTDEIGTPKTAYNDCANGDFHVQLQNQFDYKYLDFNFSSRQMNGNLDKVSITFSGGDWTAQQFLYCTGQETLTIGGIQIQRYGQGTAACDSIVPQFCANTAYLIANPFAQKACACINEQARLELQFQGLDLPVQCFTDVCSEADPQVYKTANQLKGCSARLCVQILTINGSAIASEGFQTMTCDGQVYNTSSATTNATPVPVSTSTPGGPSLGIVFYVALGLLVFMVILLVVWGIRRFVIQKRKQNRQNELIVKSFENVLKK